MTMYDQSQQRMSRRHIIKYDIRGTLNYRMAQGLPKNSYDNARKMLGFPRKSLSYSW